MKKLRKLIERYEKAFMIVLIVVILVIFTVTGDIMSFLQGGAQGGRSPEELAGAFQILPGAPVQVTYAEYGNAASQLSLASRVDLQRENDRISDLDIWTHIVLREAARHEGITISNAQLVGFLREFFLAYFQFDLQQDYARYVDILQVYFNTKPLQFEAAVREVMTARRVRGLYQQAYVVAPPGPREAVVSQYTSQNIEYARGTFAAYPASLELDAARTEFKADAEPDKTLKEFFEKDPAVRNERVQFQHPKRYKLELLYVMARNVFDKAGYQRLEDLFFKALPVEKFPTVTVENLEAKVTEEASRDFFRLYKDRILKLFPGWELAKSKIEEAFLEERRQAAIDKAPKAATDLDETQAAELAKRLGELAEDAGDEEKAGVGAAYLKELLDAAIARAPKSVEDLDGDVADLLAGKVDDKGFEVAKFQVESELKVRGMMWQLRDLAAVDPAKNLKETFDLLAKVDDPEDPICSTEADKGILVYRTFEQPLSGDELSALEDSGDTFTVNFRHRVTTMGSEDLPRVNQKPETMGELANGRVIIRLIDIEEARRKTFSELTDGEKEDLANDFFLPEKARGRAKEKLEAHRQKLIKGEIAAEDFTKSVRQLDPQLAEGADVAGSRVRVHKNEWITASHDFLAEPDRSLYWQDEFLHMRDRNFLHSNLALVLGRDRLQKELKAGSYLEIQLDSRGEGDDIGTAYLMLLLERRSPDAETMPPDEFESLISFTRRGRASEERQRWTGDFNNLISSFGMEFYGDMQDRIQEALGKLAEARLRGAQ